MSRIFNFYERFMVWKSDGVFSKRSKQWFTWKSWRCIVYGTWSYFPIAMFVYQRIPEDKWSSQTGSTLSDLRQQMMVTKVEDPIIKSKILLIYRCEVSWCAPGMKMNDVDVAIASLLLFKLPFGYLKFGRSLIDWCAWKMGGATMSFP